jgi:two-component system CheB/CheR fusion protein
MPKKKKPSKPEQRQEKKIVATQRKAKSETRVKSKAESLFPIVGIGASAGGLEAFTDFLKKLPADTGMAFVFIQHLAAGQESLLTDILARSTPMTVHRVKNDMSVNPNTVYVIPPDVNMTIVDHSLKLQPQVSKLHRPVDQFLVSLAKQAKNRAIGVVLSGTGTDGTEGLKAIYAEGGITFTQDEDSAKYAGMPHSGVAAGVVHFSLPPHKIAEELTRIGKHPYLNHAELKVVKPEIEEEDNFRTILALLRLTYGVDFSAYKESTVNRRLSRRMVINQIDNMDDYVKVLRTDKTEMEALFFDLLIGVTSFFREPEAFDLLTKEVFPIILDDKTRKFTVRIWVPGCSTGEEVYSIAICLREYLEKTGTNVNVQIFGTDVSDKNIEKARSGLYPETIVDDIAEERLNNFFFKSNNHYQISKPIRDMCIFAKQDLTRDPPFSNLDIVSCRDVLIYFKPQIQKKLIPLFHYALKPGGFLLLGKSESVGGFKELFAPINKGIVYTKRPVASKAAFGMAIVEPFASKDFSPKKVTERPLTILEDEIERILLSRYTPPGVVVNEDMDILIFRGNLTPYISPSSGEASLNLMQMVREELRFELQTANYLAKKQKQPVKRTGIVFKQNGKHKEINIEVVPIKPSKSKDTFFLVLFEEVVPISQKKKLKPLKIKSPEESIKNGQISDLKHELASTKETLQTIIEEQEATNEELRAALEEVQSSNEELQSTNEELETAKEELQSTNEELNTLNEELANRNRQLTRMHDDLNNLFGNIDVAVIVLDNNLKIRLFNPIAEKIFNLIPTDAGRPISDIRLKLTATNLEGQLSGVLESLVPKQLEVQDEKARWYELRMRPYLTAGKKIDGVVLTLVDVDNVVQSKINIEKSRNFAESVLETINEPLVVLDADLKVIMANRAFYKIFKAKPAEVLNKLIYKIGGKQWDIPELKQTLEKVLLTGKAASGVILGGNFPEIGRRVLSLNMMQLPISSGKGEEILVTAEDITESKELEMEQEQRRKNLEKRLESAEHLAVIGQTAGMVGHDIRNPLQTIVSATYLAKEDVASLPQSEIKKSLIESLREIEDQAAYIGKIVSDLQDYSRPLRPSKDEIDLGKLIEDLLLGIKPKKNMEVLCEVEDGIQRVKADSAYVKRILINLILNALQAMPDGGTITITARNEKGNCLITVKDTGEGIPDDIKPNIFQPLFTTKSRGQGFGLAVSKRLAKSMGGDLTFESEEGNGSEFTLKLPKC